MSLEQRGSCLSSDFVAVQHTCMVAWYRAVEAAEDDFRVLWDDCQSHNGLGNQSGVRKGMLWSPATAATLQRYSSADQPPSA